MGKPAEAKQSTQISEALQAPSQKMIDVIMAQAGVNPWDLENTAPRVAAFNQAQKDVMDATAGAGNAFGFDFTSATQGLPTETIIGGMPAYDALGLAKSGISPEMQALYDRIYGAGGILAGGGGGGGGGGNSRLDQIIKTIDGGRRVVFPGDNEGAGGR